MSSVRAPDARFTAPSEAPRREAALIGDREDLAQALARAIEGEVRFGAGDRALYATDASNYRQPPLGLVLPRHARDIAAAVEICRRFDAPIVMRGCGTSLAGQTCNDAVLIDTSKYMHDVRAIDGRNRLAEVDPGCVLDDLRRAAERHGLTFGPDPATHDHNTLGGMIGNNSCGVHSIMAGRTSDNVRSLRILTYDGLELDVGPTRDEELRAHLLAGGRRAEIYRALLAFRQTYRDLIVAKYPPIPRRVSGYENLDQLFEENGFNVARALVGTEGTCVIVLGATLELVPSPPHRVLALIGFPDVCAAGDVIPEALAFGPIALEGFDGKLVQYLTRKRMHMDDLKLLPDGDAWLMVEFGAEQGDEAEQKARNFAACFEKKGRPSAVLTAHGEQERIWKVRESALAATAHVPGMKDTYPGWEDSAVPPQALGRYMRALKKLLAAHGYEGALYGHFGDGLIHTRLPFDQHSADGIRNWKAFLEEAADLVVSLGGSLSGEHGDGQARAALLEKMYGPELVRAFGAFKAIWDPRGRMNPGKVVDPYPIMSNLRLGPSYRPATLKTVFAYPEDGGAFAKTAERCVGVGACRRRDSEEGVMCPSYMVTNEERHSTRGRARLLFEMVHGGPINDLWRSEEVKEALELCLSCKGCKRDCPVQVDMAKYKSEFMAHHYEGRLRPRAAYSMGLIYEWARLARRAPAFANALTNTPVISSAVKWVGGIAQARTAPRFAPETFSEWFNNRTWQGAGERVMLWPDTFNNHFRPQTAQAAAHLLEALGFKVAIPTRPLCCGRPLYDWGLLARARKRWREILDALAPDIDRGTPIVGLEPACVSAFRDELPALFPNDARAHALAKTAVFLSEFLAARAKSLALPAIGKHALVHLHCHHHAVLDAGAETALLEACGVDHEVLRAGCCGMAGSFGFEWDKFDVSVKAGERALLPRARAASPESVILANGFSCREQIEQGAGRRTTHIAELLVQGIP